MAALQPVFNRLIGLSVGTFSPARLGTRRLYPSPTSGTRCPWSGRASHAPLPPYPFIPVVATPSMKKRWARKKRMIIGTVKITDAAIQSAHWVS